MSFRLLPRSLFARLVLVLLTGLVIAQLLSFAVHMHERGELLSQASGMQAAQRIADIVKLLDPLAPAERERIVKVFSAPPIVIRLDTRALPAAREDAEATARAALFERMLRRYLGEGRPVAVAVTDAPAGPARPDGMARPDGKPRMKGRGMHGEWTPPWAEMHGALSFVAQVRLQDGALVTFDARQPVRTESWPYRLLLSVLVLLVAVVVVSLIAVRWATRPLNDLADAADELGRNIHRPPMAEQGPVEVARAAHAFNTMQSRVAGYLRERTALLAAMSHDLKTPVTRLRLRAELLEDPRLREKFTRDLDDMESMVRATLDFIRGMESGETVQPVDVAALLESLQADIVETGGRVVIEGRAAAPYPGQPQALKRCLANLIENAVKYGRSARVVVEDSRDRLQIRVLDEGPGVPETELEKVFEPFYRVEGSRSRETGGTGLGLTIARGIVEAHGGSLVLRNSARGGLEAVLALPRRGAPAGIAGGKK